MTEGAGTIRDTMRPNLVGGLVLLLGAGTYALAVGALGLTFNVTPFWVGAFALFSGVASRQTRLVSIALPLIGWGTAVLLVLDGPIPNNRAAAAYLLGAGVGMLGASIWARRTGISTVGASLAVVSGGLSFYLAYDIDALGRWPVWAGLITFWALVEAIRPSQSHSDNRREGAHHR